MSSIMVSKLAVFIFGLIGGLVIANINQSTRNTSLAQSSFSSSSTMDDVSAGSGTARSGTTTTHTRKLPLSSQGEEFEFPMFTAPHHCGAVFFYHNGGTGGSSFNGYLLSYVDEGYPHYTIWGGKRKVGPKFVEGVTQHIQNLTGTSPTGWKVIHSHHMNYGMNDTLPMLRKWKYDVEVVQGCKFLLTTIARDPLDHFLAKFRYKGKNDTTDTFIKRTRKMAHLEYFMYNWHRNGGPFNDTEEYIEYPNITQKVETALQIVDKYYDIVVMDSNVTKLEHAVGEWTNWTKHPSEHKNSGKDVVFTKKEIKQIRALLDKDGDTEFYRQLKLRQQSQDHPNVI